MKTTRIISTFDNKAQSWYAKLTAVLRASRIVDAGTEPADSAADADADADASLALDAELR